MYDFGRPFGESCYRLISRTGQFIYLRTRGSLEVDETTREVRSFVCVNTLVSDEEGRRLVREMKKKFSAIISEAELKAMESDVPTVENPQKLESAILNLITGLNNQTSYDDENVDNCSMISDSTTGSEDTRRNIKSPPLTQLSIIPPKPNSIKTSIFNAVCVIGHIKDEPKSPETPNQTISRDTSTPFNIKKEPTSNILSPGSSSLSSHDSDISSSFLSNQNVTMLATSSRETIYTNCNEKTTHVLPNNSTGDYFTPYNDLPVYGVDTIEPNVPASSTNDSIMIASNNNNSNVNRNSVLKRSFNSKGDEHSELIKKRSLGVDNSTSLALPIDLLPTSGSGKNQ